MEHWPEHSLYSYLKRLPTEKLELIWDTRRAPAANTILTAEDYRYIEKILRNRPDSKLFAAFSEFFP